MKIKIINATPHPINIIGGETIPVSGISIRLKSDTVACEPIGDIPTTTTKFGKCEGLPIYQYGTFYIVSQLVKSANPLRSDLLVPAEIVRDSEGKIVGCKSLGR
ncbi:hypothetical protein LQZ18_15540 [Lachnospiraceae bacterium ZAX-1]